MRSAAWPVGGSLLASALLGEEEQLALDALELLCVSPRSGEAATELEMRLLSTFLPLRLKGGSPNSHRAIGNAVRRWLARLRTSSALVASAARDSAWYDAQGFAERGGAAAIATAEGAGATAGAAVAARAASVERHRAYAARVGVWVDGFARLLLGALYPGTPFERSTLAMKLYDIHLAAWAVSPNPNPNPNRPGQP